MRQSLHLERPQEMHHFYWGVDAHSRPQTPPPPHPQQPLGFIGEELCLFDLNSQQQSFESFILKL